MNGLDALSIAGGLLLPILAGGTCSYLVFIATQGRWRAVSEAIGWIVTLALAVLLFPVPWRGMEYATLALLIGDLLLQMLLNVVCQPLARRIARRRLERLV